MDMHEQFVVRQVLSMTGQVVPVREDTLATDKKNNPCYLEKGRQVKISGNPLTFDPHGDVHINVLDESNKYLSMRISDYIRDIYASD